MVHVTTQARVASRIYYDDPAALEFTAEITAIREVARVEGRQVWQIALDRTAFYPTGGGQPFDTGELVATARSGAALHVPITNVEEDDAGEVWHTTAKPLQEGTAVRGSIDAERRRDHMQQHSGQHLLSAVLRRDLGAATLSFHMGKRYCTIDLDCGPLTEDTLAQMERAANDAMGQALPFAVRYASREAAEAMLRDGALSKLPPRVGRIRLVEIAGLDLNACGGTHVANSAASGPLLLRGMERVRDTTRLSFVCGGRALDAGRSEFLLLDRLARSLSTGTAEVAEAVAQLQAEKRIAGRERALLLQSLAAEEAFRLAAMPRAQGAPLIHVLDPAEPARDAGYAKLLAARLVSNASIGVALVALPGLAGSEPGEDRCSVVLAAKPGALDCGHALRTALAAVGGRGGGSHDLAQGSLPQAAMNQFFSLIRESIITDHGRG